jgi:hypothetical protein
MAKKVTHAKPKPAPAAKAKAKSGMIGKVQPKRQGRR